MSRRSEARRAARRRVEPEARWSLTPWIVGGIAIVVVVAAIVAIVIANTGSPGVSEPAARPVVIGGDHLPAFSDPSPDLAVGQQLPGIAGVGMDGSPLAIGPDDGPMAIVVLAHWCPHCQAELPGLVDYIASGAAPEGVSVVGVSTSIDPVRPNFPPSAWFEREGWTQPTLIDDAGTSALHALGLRSFPGFVFVDDQGLVRGRLTGEIGVERFASALASIAP